MEGLSKGILFERTGEEYGSMLSRADSSATSSASSSKRTDFSDLSLSSIQQSYKVNSLIITFEFIIQTHNLFT